ncbi:MAG TPA: Fur family transcriptional regulator, partial [Candidatus Deferrimicrobiaceae bacterium]|nr:Fur family transcriptional regulator [Candidatus Deferrimicrobiaceae bacterium]
MDNDRDAARERFRSLGHPATRGRGEILRILAESPLPLSPREIRERIPNPKPDASTVYRNLTLMVSIGLVRSVALHERSRRYEAATDGAHRHRVVCRKCGRIESFQPKRCDLSRIENDIRGALGFDVTDHSLEFFGACAACGEKKAKR